ncbi:hypothetical protein [Streptosporangium roseum]|uniref:hypothetical protein n=1 Tax=Streptosporangium roseum TaxID=2001 RepID=UPI00332D0C85
MDDSGECTWTDVLRGRRPSDGEAGVAWAGRLTADWTQIIQVRGFDCEGALRELSYGGRALLMRWDINGPRDLEYAVNGHYVTDFSVTVPGRGVDRVREKGATAVGMPDRTTTLSASRDGV